MQFFGLLEEKLSSNIDLSKRIKLAQNAFVTSGLTIALKEEYILTWFLKTYFLVNHEHKENVIDGFEYCISSNHMKILPTSAIRACVKTDIVSNLKKVLKNMNNVRPLLIDSIISLFKTPTFSSHFRRHPKKFTEIMDVILKRCSDNSQTINLLTLITEIFNSHLLKEKFSNALLEKGIISLLKNVTWEKEINLKLIHLFQILFFKKSNVTEFQIVLNQIFMNNPKKNLNEMPSSILRKLHEIYSSDLDDNIKANSFNLWFQAFAKSCNEENNSYALKFFICMCHVIGIEQLVVLKEPLINKETFQRLFENISAEPSSTSYAILKSLLTSLSEYSFDLSESINSVTYLQWFQALVLKLSKESKLDSCLIGIFGACAEVNAVIVESTIGEIMSGLLSQSKKVFTNTFQLDYENFMISLLKIFSKLQRFQKFISKILPSIRNTKSKLKVENVVTVKFIQEFKDIVTILPSLQCLSLMDLLLEELDENCVKILEENSDESLNVLFLQALSELLTAFFLGVKILSHSIPQSILEKFVHLMNKLKLILNRFGVALLSRTHDRSLVRPFLKICFYWGEMETLISFYSPEHSEELVTRDVAPTDLSLLHCYLDGSQWSVLAERISNFGAGGCNQLFLKLVLQKLRISKLRKNQTIPNVEVTTKYILIQLTSELYRHNIVEELSPEDLSLIISHLTPAQCKLLLEKLLNQLREHEDKSKLSSWILDSSLRENPLFVKTAFSIIVKKIFDCFKLNESNGSSFTSKLFSSCGFFDESNEIIEDDLKKLSENLKEILKDPKKIRKENEELNELIKILNVLPLPYVPAEIRPLALVLITSLAVIYTKDENITEGLLKTIYNVLMNDGEISSCLDVGLCIKWLVEFEDWRDETKIVRYKIIEILIKSSVITKKGLEEVGGLVKLLKKRKMENENNLLEAEVLVYLDLGKSWQRSKKYKSENDTIGGYRKIVSECMKKKLKSVNGTLSQVNNDVLLKAYSIVLTTAVRSKNEDEINRILGLNFENYFDFAIKDLDKNSRNDGSVMFLSSVINCLPEIRSRLPKDVVKKIWPVLKFRRDVDWRLFCKSFSDEEFDWLINDLASTTQILLTHEDSDPSDLQACFNIWQNFLSEKIDPSQNRLELLFGDLQCSMNSIATLPHEKIIALLRFLHFCAGKSEIRMTSFMVDTLFDVILESRFDGSAVKFHDVFIASVEIIISCVLSRYAWIQDKVQNLFQIFNFLLEKLVKRSDLGLNLNDDDVSLMATCAFYLERCSKALIDKCGRDIAKLAPYFISEIVFSFVTISIYPVIKVHLTNCVNNFLSISDSHGITYLLRVLSPACQQVFQKIYDHYKKYYQFTGKV